MSFSIPSPPVSVWYLGPIPIRAYAIALLLGIILAIYIGDRRYRRMGGPKDTYIDVAVWAVVLGIIFARIYYVVSTPDAYFGPNGNPIDAFKIWEGGIAILGSLMGGALGIFIGLKRRGLRFAPFVDALAPGLILAQAVGRFGNYFNQELFGTPTDLPWGLEIDAAHMPPGYPEGTLFHPTFLYEQIWNVIGAVVIVVLERKLRLKGGQVILTYLMWYSFGRFWIEIIRTDFAHSFGLLRFNSWAALLVFVLAVVLMVVATKLRRTHPELSNIFVNEKDQPADKEGTAAGVSGNQISEVN